MRFLKHMINRMKHLKCPKCKSSTIMFTECWAGAVIWFYQVDGVIEDTVSDGDHGDPYKVEA
jgi:hypothetical protein